MSNTLMPNIVILDAFTANPGDLSWDVLASLGKLTIYDNTPRELIVERAQDAQILLINKIVLNQRILDQLPKLKYIGALSTGINTIDLDICRERGIPVCNIPAYSTASVAQLTFAHILNHAHRVELHSQQVMQGDWVNCKHFSYFNTPQIELQGKTMGILGFGQIGQAIARIALAFGMQVLFYNRSDKSGLLPDTQQVSLKQIFTDSDYISINSPLTPETQHLVNKDLLDLSQRKPVLINTARGQLIEENDVAAALYSGQLRAFCGDVLSTEPPKADNPILQAPNCFLTPHIGWATQEARARLIQIAADNVASFLQGTPQNLYQAYIPKRFTT